MNNDIVPSLLEEIQKQFDEEIKANEKIKSILIRQKQGAVDYTDSLSFAKELGVSLKKVIQENISEEMLPDGKMYYNIAQRLLEPMIKQNYDLVSKQCEVTQNILNKKADLGLKAIAPEYNKEKTASIIDYISNAEKVTNEVEIPYTYKDGIYSAEYDTEQFVNALTGNLVTAYQELMQDVQKELSEETGDEKNN